MEVRVYYEDTDAGGVVYHANYLNYMARGRIEYLRDRGLSVSDLHEQGYVFPVVRLEIDYLSPAVHDDLLRVETRVLEVGKASFTLGQQVVRASDGTLLTDGKATLVCVGPGKKPRRLPAAMVRALGEG
jgi:acyl-CoA thioester hydrolase